jgi:hypothetical protein
MVQEYRSCAEALKANRNSHLWNMYDRRPRETTYLRSLSDLVGLVGVLFGSSRSTSLGPIGGWEQRGRGSKGVGVTWPMGTGVSELSATETDGRDLALS